MRNKFVGGPNAGQVYLSEDLVNDRELSESIPFEDYTAGPSYRTEDGIEMRDWKFRTTPKEKNKMSDTSASTGSSVETSGTQSAAAAPEAAAEQGTNAGETYEARRKAIKGASRAKLAEASGLTQSAVWRIENKGPKNDDERDLYEAGLAKLSEA